MSSADAYGHPKTRIRILEATWELLEEHAGDLRLADVAERAGVSRQAIYLHFGDRPGLLIALVDHIDHVHGSEQRIAHVLDAPTGVDALRRMIDELSTFTDKIDSVAQILDAGSQHDAGLAAAWNDRMSGRRAISRLISERIAQEGRLASEWTIATAADVIYTVTQPGPWHVLVRELGWTANDYAENIWRLLRCSLIDE